MRLDVGTVCFHFVRWVEDLVRSFGDITKHGICEEEFCTTKLIHKSHRLFCREPSCKYRHHE